MKKKIILSLVTMCFSVAVFAQSTASWKLEAIYPSFDFPISNSFKNADGTTPDLKSHFRTQWGIGLIRADLTSLIEPYVKVHYVRRAVTMNTESESQYSTIRSFAPEIGTFIKLSPLNIDKPTKGRFVLNMSASYNLPFSYVLRKDNRKGDKIDFDKKMFDGKGFQVAAGIGYDIRKNEYSQRENRDSRRLSLDPTPYKTSSYTFRAHFHIGLDYVHDFSNYFNKEVTVISGNNSYIRLKLIMGIP